MKFSLWIGTDEYKRECCGCGASIPIGEKHLDGIESCCGGCYRQLCFTCVRNSFHMIEEDVSPVPEKEIVRGLPE